MSVIDTVQNLTEIVDQLLTEIRQMTEVSLDILCHWETKDTNNGHGLMGLRQEYENVLTSIVEMSELYPTDNDEVNLEDIKKLEEYAFNFNISNRNLIKNTTRYTQNNQLPEDERHVLEENASNMFSKSIMVKFYTKEIQRESQKYKSNKSEVQLQF